MLSYIGYQIANVPKKYIYKKKVQTYQKCSCIQKYQGKIYPLYII
jgi:hypothetical protein